MSIRSLLALVALLGGMTTSTASAAEPTQVTLATATPGGGFPVYGHAFASVIHSVDPTLVIVERNTKGSTENIPLLEARKVDLGLVQGEAAYEALNGIGPRPVDLRILAAMYPAPGMFVVKAGSGAKTIADLKGSPVAFGAAGSGLVILARYVLDGLGLDQTRDFKAVFLQRAGDGPAMVADGRVAALWGGGIGWPGFKAVAGLPGGARFIFPSADEITRIQAKHPFLKTLVVPAGSYPGQTEAMTSVGSWSFVLARPDLDDTIAYRLAKALHAAETRPESQRPPLDQTRAKNTLNALPRPDLLHPGVARYLREAGLLP